MYLLYNNSKLYAQLNATNPKPIPNPKIMCI